MGDVHLNVFFDDLVIGGLRHFINVVQCRFQIDQRRKTEIAFRKIDLAQLSGKRVNIFKQVSVYLPQCRKGPHRQGIQPAALKQPDRLFLAKPFFLSGKQCSIGKA